MTITRPLAAKLARLLRERPSDFSVGKPEDYPDNPEYMVIMIDGPAPFSIHFNDAEFILEVDRRDRRLGGAFFPWEIVNHHSYGYTPRTDTPWEDITPTLATILPDPL